MNYFLIPVYNESENISTLAKTLRDALPGLPKTYIFVDDGSSDDTCEVIEKMLEGTTFHILQNPGNSGPGYSFNSGFNYILDTLKASDRDNVITLEGDNTSDPSLIPIMHMLYQQGFDLVLASPYAQGGGFDQTTFFRKLTSFSANLILRLWFDVKVLTLSSFFRLYSVSLLKKIRSEYGELIREKGFISMVEILVKAIRIQAKMIEIPMILDSTKRKGKSKMKVFKTMLSYVRFFIRPHLSLSSDRRSQNVA
jgi:dolichol-phosphate mannosyltransferase